MRKAGHRTWVIYYLVDFNIYIMNMLQHYLAIAALTVSGVVASNGVTTSIPVFAAPYKSQ
jgi:hypothetical protein